MSKTKIQAQAPKKTPPPPTVQQQSEEPEKEGGPLPITRTADLMTSEGPVPSTADRARMMTDMQQAVGNTRLTRMLDATVQTKLTVGAPNDTYEQEADRVAKQVGGTTVSPSQQAMQRQVEEEEPLQTKPLVQRQVEEQEPLPTKPLLRRQVEEEPLQAKPLVQRQVEGEEPLQAEPLVQRQPTTAGATVEPALKNQYRNTNQTPQRPIMRTPAPRIQRRRARGLISAEVREIRRKLKWFGKRIDRLETERTITSEEAEGFRSGIERLLRETDELRKRRKATREEARRIWLRGRRLLRIARDVRRLRRRLRQRAARGRSTRGLRLISDFQVRPPVIRVHEGEAARISFVLRRRARSITWFILSHEGGGDVGTLHRFFRVRNNDPGYKVAIWNGTWEGGRNRPPEPGTYRVRLWVTDHEGNREEVFDQIRVENPDRMVVHPRHESGYALQSLRFDGSCAVLTDEAGNTIRMRAVSGLKRNHRLNRRRIDYTRPRHQWVENRGPIPEGTYTIRRNSVQQPELRQRALRFPRGATARVWGPIRVPLYPLTRSNRSGFFVHIDVGNDGTAGCIGIHPDDEGKFNNVMSLLARMPNDLPVEVSY